MTACNRRSAADSRQPTRPSAFTLIELLVVLAIIGILAAVGLAVAGRVSEGSKFRSTENVLRALDSVITAYASALESNPNPFYTDDSGNTFPLVDGRLLGRSAPSYLPTSDPAQPTLSLFLLQAEKVPACAEALRGIDARYLKRGPVSARGWARTATDISSITLDNAPSVEDAWGNPIRLVHPAFSGGAGNYFTSGGEQTRSPLAVAPQPSAARPSVTSASFGRSVTPFDRSTGVRDRVGDADEGTPPGNRPYVYSPGPDRDPATRDDNIYVESARPKFPVETQNLPAD